MQLHPKLRRIFDVYTDILFLVIFLVTGILYLWQPQFAAYALIGMVVAYLLIGGVIRIVRYFRNDVVLHGPDHSLAIGAGMIICGIVFVIGPYMVIDLTTLFLSVVLFADALHLLQTAVDGFRTHTQKWWAYLIPLGLALCGGFFFLFIPDQSVLCGCTLLVISAATLALLILRKFIDAGASAAEATAQPAEAPATEANAAPAEVPSEECKSAEAAPVQKEAEAPTASKDAEVHEAPKMPFDHPVD